ncbi:MAG: MarR family transcriptional regulator [Bacteroidia bacterium]|nr:MarR family transcriptional regulator [Bacteroidia bacterium]
MKLAEAQEKFIQSWGALASSWGINRTMAQVHALLMIAPQPMSAEEIMERLNISRGSANMNLRALIDWGLVRKELKQGDRKEYFVAEKDIWTIAMRIIQERKRRELNPVSRIIEEVSEVEIDKNDPEAIAFQQTIENIQKFLTNADILLTRISNADENWFTQVLMKMLTKT